MKLVVHFDDPQGAATSISGGKGANLTAMTLAGFPVPPGFVVTSEAYVQFLRDLDWLEPAIAQLNYQHPDRLEQQCAALRRRLTQTPLPAPVEQAIRDALKRMGSDNSEALSFAVRSSSTFEDLAQAAFAGQHDTYLNIRGADRILDRVRACFASLWEARAVLYRQHHGFSQRDAQMAVVVQRQIPSDVAGVAFSIDPVAGVLDRITIDANFGVGESVVSGEGEVDHFEIDKATLGVLARSIGHKQNRVVAEGDGVREVAIPAEQADQPSLSDEQIAEIARLALKIEEHYGWPQDIEWAIHLGRLHLLQSRPVTTIQPQWTRDESAERFPNAMTPLSWDFISVAFRTSLNHSLALMGLPPLKGDWFRMFDHYIYGDQNAVRLMAAFRPLRARNAAELVEEIPSLRRRFAWVIDLPVNWARDLDRYLIRLGRLESRPEPRTLPEAWQFTCDVLDVAEDYFRPNIAISLTQSGLHRLLHALVAMVAGPDKGLGIVDGLLAGCETKTAMVNRELHEMALLAAEMPGFKAELLDRGSRAFLESGKLEAYPAMAARFARFLKDHGHREVDMDYSQPTWAGQPWVVMDSVALLLRSESIQSPEESMRTQRIRNAQAEPQFLAGVPEPLRFFFRELIRLTRTYTTLDDLEHYQTTRINPLAYRAAMNMGRLLRNIGALDEDRDVFFLNKTDLEAIVKDATAESIRRCHEKAIAQKKGYQSARRQTPPWSREQAQSPEPAAGGNVLRGLPGSPGQATGKCFRVRGPEDFARFPAGSVLVARTTNPAWTPLFYAAAAVITESGGPLSHGAVTAREMGLPAVMSVRGIMEIVSDGQAVTVDGTRGIVEL